MNKHLALLLIVSSATTNLLPENALTLSFDHHASPLLVAGALSTAFIAGGLCAVGIARYRRHTQLTIEHERLKAENIQLQTLNRKQQKLLRVIEHNIEYAHTALLTPQKPSPNLFDYQGYTQRKHSELPSIIFRLNALLNLAIENFRLRNWLRLLLQLTPEPVTETNR